MYLLSIVDGAVRCADKIYVGSRRSMTVAAGAGDYTSLRSQRRERVSLTEQLERIPRSAVCLR